MANVNSIGRPTGAYLGLTGIKVWVELVELDYKLKPLIWKRRNDGSVVVYEDIG